LKPLKPGIAILFDWNFVDVDAVGGAARFPTFAFRFLKSFGDLFGPAEEKRDE
jgi:hypothetical protein